MSAGPNTPTNEEIHESMEERKDELEEISEVLDERQGNQSDAEEEHGRRHRENRRLRDMLYDVVVHDVSILKRLKGELRYDSDEDAELEDEEKRNTLKYIFGTATATWAVTDGSNIVDTDHNGRGGINVGSADWDLYGGFEDHRAAEGMSGESNTEDPRADYLTSPPSECNITEGKVAERLGEDYEAKNLFYEVNGEDLDVFYWNGDELVEEGELGDQCK